ncbi:DNA-directed RNA polymerase III subunit RPC6-like [Ptychodera flava]|uniref:DNA-directed RNA polymerase III subunit RPC6-like n=1 Tax=Ptychodera flava TaxID=63121 RepID=UPI00396A258D
MAAAPDPVLKQEPTTDAVDLENRILELCQQNPKGIGDGVIQADMPHIDIRQRVSAVNRLLSTGRIDLLKTATGLLYRLKDPQAGVKIKSSDNQEKLIYQIIEESGNKGIWIRDIRYKSNLLLTQVSKILKNLESKKLIKAIKSVGASKRKVYMLDNVEPDRSVTGGAWYSDQDFESEFVEVLNQQCYKFLQQRADNARATKQDPLAVRNACYASLLDVRKYIMELGISKVDLSVDDIETILNTLIYDNKVEMTIVASQSSASIDGQMKLYRAIEPLIKPTGLTRMPCGVCPVFDQCYIGGVVSPSNCVYIKQWLELDF